MVSAELAEEVISIIEQNVIARRSSFELDVAYRRHLACSRWRPLLDSLGRPDSSCRQFNHLRQTQSAGGHSMEDTSAGELQHSGKGETK